MGLSISNHSFTRASNLAATWVQAHLLTQAAHELYLFTSLQSRYGDAIDNISVKTIISTF